MSDSRKILVPKRGRERNTSFEHHRNKNDNLKQGIKRPLPCTPTKNLANDRLKRLRTSLNEEAQKRPDKAVSSAPRVPNPRKRAVEACSTVTQSKVPRNNEFAMSVLLKSATVKSKNSDNSAKAVASSDIEVMEWSPASASVELANSVMNRIESTSLNEGLSSNSSDFYIVVDTNIFISQMQLVKDIIEMNVEGSKKPIIFIPWIVIEELDFIKEDSNKTNLKWKAQSAIKYIETTLSNKNERMMGQTLNQVNEQQNVGMGQDNKIIACCLQVQEKHKNMILLTDDINLKNKAHINRIPVCSHSEIKTKMTVAFTNSSKSKIILDKMTSLCKSVIQECAMKAYGQASKKMPICQQAPQTLQDCIQIFSKYWFPVFQEVLMKQFKKSIDDLSSFLSKNEAVKDGSSQLNDLLRLCVRCCIFLKDVESCRNTIENTIRDLNNIKES